MVCPGLVGKEGGGRRGKLSGWIYTSRANGTLIFPNLILDTEAYRLMGVEEEDIIFRLPLVDLVCAAWRSLDMYFGWGGYDGGQCSGREGRKGV